MEFSWVGIVLGMRSVTQIAAVVVAGAPPFTVSFSLWPASRHYWFERGGKVTQARIVDGASRRTAWEQRLKHRSASEHHSPATGHGRDRHLATRAALPTLARPGRDSRFTNSAC